MTCHESTVNFRSFLDWAAIAEAPGPDAHINSALLTTTSPATAKARAKAMKIRSFVQTESVVSSDEFTSYQIGQSCLGAAMVFTLPEVRHFAQVCDMGDDEFFIFGVAPGQPVLLTNTRKPLLTAAQQRRGRQVRGEREGVGGEGGEEFVASTLPPSPTSVAESQYSYNTNAAMEQGQKTWSGELILATLAPEAAMQSSQQTPSQQGVEARGGQERRASPSPQPEGGRMDGATVSPPGSQTYDI